MVVLGASGSGKTCLAQALALRLGAPHVELDALYWEASWQPAPPEVFRARVAEALAGPGYAHLTVFHLRSPRETDQWLTSYN